MEWFILVLGIILCGGGIFLIFHAKKRDTDTINYNEELQKQKEHLEAAISAEEKKLVDIGEQALQRAKWAEEQLSAAYQKIDNIKSLMRQAYEKYSDELDNVYCLKENDFDRQIKELEKELQQKKIEIDEEYEIFKENLINSYNLIQSDILEKIDENKKELEKYKNTWAAALEAHRREQEIEQKSDFYRVHLTESEKSTIALIEELKPRLPDPRVLSMLVWQTFYQKKIKTLCANVLGIKTVCGIYKITNLKTGMCYIGQAVNIGR